MNRRVRLVAAISAALVTASCQVATEAANTTLAPSPGPQAAQSTGVVDGTFDVGGHSLYLQCAGTGTPTVVYMHGAFDDPGIVPHANGEGIQQRLAEDYRVCVYDRRNVGDSDTVDAPQSPDDALTDMRQLLAAADVEPPYVLLGASFGGLLAYLYANTYPDEVVGMVLLDSMFPDELALDRYFPPEETYQAFDADDECCTLERISHYKAMKAAEAFIGQEPAIPAIYFASEQAPWDLGVPEYDQVIRDVQAAYVERFSPGVLRWVDSPHFMEPEIPDEIADAVREVVAG